MITCNRCPDEDTNECVSCRARKDTMNAIKDDVTALVDKELKAANERFPLFSSAHEGYAVILEELEETTECIEWANGKLNDVWECIKCNKLGLEGVHVVKAYAEQAAIEAIQTAAMCQKYIDSMTRGD